MTNKKTKNLLTLTVIATILALVGFFLLFFNIKNRGEEISRLQNEIDLAYEQTGRLDSLKAILTDTESQRNSLAKSVVASEGVVVFAEMLERLGAELKVEVRIDALETKPALEEQVGLELLAIRLTAIGGWRGVSTFFAALESLPYGLRLSQVSLSQSAGGKGGETFWTGNFAFEVLKIKSK